MEELGPVQLRLWLIASLVALLGGEGPFCALACVADAPSATAQHASTPTGAAEHPCHEPAESSPNPPTCDDQCAHFAQALPTGQPASTSSVVAVALAMREVSPPAQPRVAHSLLCPSRREPPSPRLFLLKSSLLI